MPIVLGDLPAAFIEFLRGNAYVLTLTGGRISAAFPEGRRGWPMPTSAIIVRTAGGLPPSQSDERRWGRVDLRFYGAGASPNVRRREARLLWRRVEPVLCPPPNAGVPMGFHAAGLIIYTIYPQTTEPITMPEPGTDWDCAVMSYMAQHARLPVAA